MSTPQSRNRAPDDLDNFKKNQKNKDLRTIIPGLAMVWTLWYGESPLETFHKKDKNTNLGAILLGCDGRTFKGKDGLDSQAEPKKRTN